jgi:acetolactate synthase I/II/III large subunit
MEEGPQMERYPGAEAFVEEMNTRGVQYIFFNPGFDTVPIQVTVTRLKDEGKPAPGLVLCLDESVAMAAAYGHYVITGKPQVVMTHRELGTFQAGGQWTNVHMGRIPIVFYAGIPDKDARRTWQGKPYDQGSIVRNNVKWDFEVLGNESMADAARKAFDVAMAEPRGPVYIAPIFEAMLKNNTKPVSAEDPKISAKKPLDAAALNKAADLLIDAQNPLILTGQSGKNAGSVDALVKLAETLGALVITSPTRMNFPTTHPLCAGADPIGGGSRSSAHYFTEADVLLMIDYDLPYAAAPIAPGPNTKVIYLTLDAVKKIHPLWDKAAEVFIEADSLEAIPALCNVIQSKITPDKQSFYNVRRAQIGGEHHKARGERKAAALSKSHQKPISPEWLSHCISQIVDDDTLIVSQVITQSSFVYEQIPRTKPGTLMYCAGGSIGWALGAALGVKLASPQKTVVSLMGDGAFVWGCPVASLWTSAAYQAPFLSVIFNNQAYAAIKGLVQRAYGEEKISSKIGIESGVDIAAPPNYAMVAQACGGFGITVKDPADLLPALKEALAQVKNGKSAVVDVWL